MRFVDFPFVASCAWITYFYSPSWCDVIMIIFSSHYAQARRAGESAPLNYKGNTGRDVIFFFFNMFTLTTCHTNTYHTAQEIIHYTIGEKIHILRAQISQPLPTKVLKNCIFRSNMAWNFRFPHLAQGILNISEAW